METARGLRTHMGLAWFDGESVPLEAVELRSGGLPLLPAGTAWPACARCATPMLFRAQVPLALTTIVGPLDERTLLLFECHAEHDGAPCGGMLALVTSGEGTPREPPRCDTPTTLASIHGGLLVPFDDGGPGGAQTTLPALAELVADASRAQRPSYLRALLGGAAGAPRDRALVCGCGKPTRTVARLVSVPAPELPLAAGVARLCLGCGAAYYHRVAAA